MLCENVINVVDLLLLHHIGDISRVGNKNLRTLCSCNNLICLFSLYDSIAILRSTLSFPTARSIFYIFLLSVSYKIVPVFTGKYSLTIRAFLLLIAVAVEGHLPLKLLTFSVRVTMSVSVFFGNSISVRAIGSFHSAEFKQFSIGHTACPQFL